MTVSVLLTSIPVVPLSIAHNWLSCLFPASAPAKIHIGHHLDMSSEY